MDPWHDSCSSPRFLSGSLPDWHLGCCTVPRFKYKSCGLGKRTPCCLQGKETPGSPALSPACSLSLILSLSHTHTHTQTHTHTHSDTHTQTHTLTHTYTHTQTHIFTHTLRHTHTHSDTHTLRHTHTHTHTHIHHPWEFMYDLGLRYQFESILIHCCCLVS